jgi:hypothetical protein
LRRISGLVAENRTSRYGPSVVKDERPRPQPPAPLARDESGPRNTVHRIVTSFVLEEQENGDWIAFTAPDVTIRGPSRTEAVLRAQAALLRATAARIERGDLEVPESFYISVRKA